MGESVSDDRATLAIAAGLVAALLGGAAWAAMVTLTEYEIGWAAWGIGAFVGWAMSRATAQRSRGLALTAAVLALTGLMAGKAMVTAVSVGPIAEELVQAPETLRGTLAWQMYEERSFDPATLDALDTTIADGDTLSDALWADMLAESGARLDAMTDDERHAIAEGIARDFVRELGFVGGIRAQLSAFDALWIFLALGTAFRMMDGAEAGLATLPAGESEEERQKESEPPLVG